MGFAVMLLLDTEFERLVCNTWKTLADAGISPHMHDAGYAPHVSLAGLASIENVDNFVVVLRDFADKTHPFSIKASHLGVFPSSEGVVFTGITMTETLRTVHRRFHDEALQTPPDSASYYAPDRWMPHCTLAYGVAPDMIGRAVETLAELGCGKERMVGVEAIAVVETPSARLIASFPFGGN